MSMMSYEQYAEWARSRYPGFRQEEPTDLTPTEEVVYAAAATEPPSSSDTCPVTIRSNRDGVVVTPRIKRSK